MLCYPSNQGPASWTIEAIGRVNLMSEQYWLIHPNGGRQQINPDQFDLTHLAEQAKQFGGRLEFASIGDGFRSEPRPIPTAGRGFEPPVSALGPLFKSRLALIHACEVDFQVDVNTRPTHRVLGGYYKSRRLIRIYSHDRAEGRRPLEELFDTFLHEVAHHLEYTEPDSFLAEECERVPGRMHSRLFWRILGDLKSRWFDHIRRP